MLEIVEVKRVGDTNYVIAKVRRDDGVEEWLSVHETISLIEFIKMFLVVEDDYTE